MVSPASAMRVAIPEPSMPSLLAEMPVGLKVGTFVHQVFEAADFAAPDLEAEIAREVPRARPCAVAKKTTCEAL